MKNKKVFLAFLIHIFCVFCDKFFMYNKQTRGIRRTQGMNIRQKHNTQDYILKMKYFFFQLTHSHFSTVVEH